jgi:hypothetical protein
LNRHHFVLHKASLGRIWKNTSPRRGRLDVALVRLGDGKENAPAVNFDTLARWEMSNGN